MDSAFVSIACMVLLAGFFAVILHPILTARRAWQRPSRQARTRLELTERKEQLVASLRELEFDHSLGKMSTADFESVRGDLESQALGVLQELEALDATPPPAADANLDARIAADVARLRTQTQQPVAAPVEVPAAETAVAAAPGPAKFCPQCGTPRVPSHRFCPECGYAFDTPST